MFKHRIRLAGPWDFRTLDVQLMPRGEATTCRLPVTLTDFKNTSGTRLLRGFHKPTGVDDNTSLRIVIQATAAPQVVMINEQQIYECAAEIDGEYVFDITTCIKAFNLLGIEFTPGRHISPPTLKNVWLEILRSIA